MSVDSENLDRAFLDISELEKNCKFSDCTHKNEPKCAIKEALENKKIKKMFGYKKEYKNLIKYIKNEY